MNSNDRRATLTVEGVSATYDEGGMILPVLFDVSFGIEDGKFVTLIGPSGCGKSTMLDIVAGLIEPDQGRIVLNGTEALAPSRLGRSAYMHQRDLLLPWRKAADNAAIALQIQGASRSKARSAAADQFGEFGLAGFEDKYPAQLSGGMRQRVAFVRTMLGGQRLVLLDEPFGSLDALTRSASQDWLAAALSRDRRTVLLVTHDVDEAIMLSDRVLVFSERPGHIVHSETIAVPRPRARSFLATEVFMKHRLALLSKLGIVDRGPGS